MKKEDIHTIIKTVLEGQSNQFNLLVNYYRRDLYLLASYKMMSSTCSDELVQDCFIRAYTQLNIFDMTKDFFIWLKTILHYLVLEKRKFLARQLNNQQNYYDYITVVLQDNYDDSFEQVQDGIEKCREGLSEDNNALLDMHYDNGLSCKLIAEQQGVKLTNITTKLCRIRKSLRKCLTKNKGE